MTVKEPDFIVEGRVGESIAVKRFSKLKPNYVIVAYRETSKEDGFIITAHLISNIEQVKRRRIVWQRS